MMKKKIDYLLFISIFCVIIFFILTIFSILGEIYEWKNLNLILQNSYISGILVTILLVPIIFEIQIIISKRKIKKDFRCNEIISDMNFILNKYIILVKNAKYSEKNKDFFIENCKTISMIQNNLLSTYNDVLIDSIKTCMFFNLNFNLMNILNNLKNRQIFFEDNNKKITTYFKTFNDENLNVIDENCVSYYFVDLRFLAQYWCELLIYLNSESSIINDNYKEVFVNPYLEAKERAKKLLKEMN